MSLKCEKCGHEIDDNTPICMYCGAAVPEALLSHETKDKVVEDKNDEYVSSNASPTKGLGVFLIILGILADIISMFMMFVFDVGFIFTVIIVGGALCFFIGLALVNNI